MLRAMRLPYSNPTAPLPIIAAFLICTVPPFRIGFSYMDTAGAAKRRSAPRSARLSQRLRQQRRVRPVDMHIGLVERLERRDGVRDVAGTGRLIGRVHSQLRAAHVHAMHADLHI